MHGGRSIISYEHSRLSLSTNSQLMIGDSLLYMCRVKNTAITIVNSDLKTEYANYFVPYCIVISLEKRFSLSIITLTLIDFRSFNNFPSVLDSYAPF